MESRSIYPSSLSMKLKHDRVEEPISFDLDEIELLKRFDSMLRALVCRGKFKLLDRPLSLEDQRKTVNDTLVELCVVYAFDGGDYISEIRENIQYVVLQAALILTITINLYVSPPDFEEENLLRAFSALSGLHHHHNHHHYHHNHHHDQVLLPSYILLS